MWFNKKENDSKNNTTIIESTDSTLEQSDKKGKKKEHTPEEKKQRSGQIFFWRNFFSNWNKIEIIDKINSIIILALFFASIVLLVICAISFDNGTKIVDLNRAVINAKWAITSLGKPGGWDYSNIYNNANGMFLLSQVGILDYFLLQLSIIFVLYSFARLDWLANELGIYESSIKVTLKCKIEWRRDSLLYTSLKAGIPAMLITIALTLWPIIVVANSTNYSALLSSKYSIFFVVAHNYSVFWYVYAIFLIAFLIAILVRLIMDIYRLKVVRMINVRDGSGRIEPTWIEEPVIGSVIKNKDSDENNKDKFDGTSNYEETVDKKDDDAKKEVKATSDEQKKSFWEEFDAAPTIEAAQEILDKVESNKKNKKDNNEKKIKE